MTNFIDIKEFREKGYLQELNRLFLHPLGLALEVIIEKDGTEKLGGIWDYREDDEGIYYDLANSDKERIYSFRRKASFVKSEQAKRKIKRKAELGYVIEPVPMSDFED